jgi:hypothetical protein
VALRSLGESERASRWAQWFAPFTAREKAILLPDHESWPNPTQEYIDHADGATALDAMLYIDRKLWLPDTLDRGPDDDGSSHRGTRSVPGS